MNDSTTLTRFWAKVNREGAIRSPDLGRCWEWTAGCHSRGYGVFYLPGKVQVLAHRYAMSVTRGPAPFPGAHVLHQCDNPPCCNPSHLRWGTHAENMQEAADRGLSKPGRANLKLCPQGHSMHDPLVSTKKHPRTGKVYTTRSCRECNRAYLARRRAAKKVSAA